MKLTRSLILGLCLMASMMATAIYAEMACPTCKAPTTMSAEMTTMEADGKCAMCGGDMTAGDEVSKAHCDKCNVDVMVCGVCAAK